MSQSDGKAVAEPVSEEILESLLAKARARLQVRESPASSTVNDPESILTFSDINDKPLPLLKPGPSLPQPYFTGETPSLAYHTSHRLASVGDAGPSAPAPPRDPSITTKQRKEMRKAAAGPSWFDLPSPAEADRPKLYREVEALRLRNQLDPKRFYRKDESEGKGINGLPKQFAIGTVVVTDKPFGGGSEDNLARSQRKRTIVDELVDDAEAKRYAKKKFQDLQAVRGERGRGTWARKFSSRKRKW